MEIAIIINKNTKQEVCPQYLHKKININKSIMQIGKDLRIVYESGSFFTHEKVIDVYFSDEYTIKVETTNKVWTIQG
jgi:hypothetical protein